MELRHLKYFLAVAGEKHFTRAARKLRVAQPALSRQIRDLEHELGVTLLERSPHRVSLTPAGQAFQAEAEAVLQRAAQAVETARAFATGTRGVIHVGYAPSLTVEVLPEALRSFQASSPGIQVILHDLSSSEMLAGLESGRLQLALSAQPSRRDLGRFEFEPLRNYPFRIALSHRHRLARHRQIKLPDLAGEPCLTYTRAGYEEYHQTLRSLFANAGASLNVAEEYDGAMSLLAAVEAGRGVALVSTCLGLLAGSRVKFIPLQPNPDPIVMGMIHARTVNHPALTQFIKVVRDAAKKTPTKRTA